MKIIFAIHLMFLVGLSRAKWYKNQPTSDGSESDEDTDLPAPPRIKQEGSETNGRMWWSSEKSNAINGPRGAWSTGQTQRGGAWWGNEKAASWWGAENTKTWWSIPTRDNYDVCRVSNNKVETITNVRYNYPSTTCYTILAKDCSSEPNFHILLRQIRKDSNFWELKVVTQYNSVILRNTNEPETVQLYINGAHYKSNEVLEITENGQIVTQVVREEEFTTVNLPAFGVQLAFDGYNVIMRFDKTVTNQLCGGVCDHRVTPNVDPLSGSVETEINEEIHKNYIVKNECIAE